MSSMKILYRKNLKMSVGKIASQCVHAAIGLYLQDSRKHGPVVVLEVSDEKFNEAAKENPLHYLVIDAGRTEVEPGTTTALAFYENIS